jgi:hypothetical protein
MAKRGGEVPRDVPRHGGEQQGYRTSCSANYRRNRLGWNEGNAKVEREWNEMGDGALSSQFNWCVLIRFDEAEQYYRRSIETNPREESAYLKLYSLAQEHGQLEDILKSLLDLGQFCIFSTSSSLRLPFNNH